MNDTQPAAAELPESGRALQPIIWDMITLWHRHADAIQAWEDAAALQPDQPMEWSRLVATLQLVHSYRWHEDEKARNPAATDSVLATAKRATDQADRLRERTAAELVDRMALLALQIYHAKEELAELRRQPSSDSDLTTPYERLRSLTEQMVDLTGCLDRFLEDLAAGRVSFKHYLL